VEKSSKSRDLEKPNLPCAIFVSGSGQKHFRQITRNTAMKMTQMFHKKLPMSHKNDYIFGEKPIVRIRGKLHRPKKLWFLHFVMMQIRRKSLNNEADLTLLLLKFHHLHPKMTRLARNDPPFSLRNDTIDLS